MNAAREAITTKRRNVGAVGAKANTQRFHGRFSFFYKRKVSCARPCVSVEVGFAFSMRAGALT